MKTGEVTHQLNYFPSLFFYSKELIISVSEANNNLRKRHKELVGKENLSRSGALTSMNHWIWSDRGHYYGTNNLRVNLNILGSRTHIHEILHTISMSSGTF